MTEGSRVRVFVTRRLPGKGVERLGEVAEVEVWPGDDPPPPEVLREKVREVDGLLTLITDRVDAALLDAAPKLRVVANLGVGYDNIDVAACTARGVLVGNTPGVLTETVADLTFALILGHARRLIEADRSVREGRWGLWHPMFMLGRDVYGATLGIVGLGAIGTAVARRARGFGMRVLYSGRSEKEEAADLGLEFRPLEVLLAEADFVSLHVALTPETRHLIGARELALMKHDAVLVNTARGGVVDQAALLAVLRERRIGGAALDVFEKEPLSPDDPLLALDNVLALPHTGSASVETRVKMVDLACANIIAVLRGERPPAAVNPEVLGG